MIALLRGQVAARGTDHVVVEVNGVGYRVGVPGPLAAELPDGGPVTLHISTVVREDDISLYGFATPAGRDAFDLLRAVSGVGTRTALAVLSAFDIGQLSAAIETDDLRALTRVNGVGRKLAGRLCLELKGKLPVDLGSPPAAARGAEVDPLPLALARLDYNKSEIDRALASPEVPAPGEASLQDRIGAALRVLARPM